MNIALVITQLEAGGAQRIALDVAETLRRRGHDCHTYFLYRKHDAYADYRGWTSLHPHRPTSVLEFTDLVRTLRRHLQSQRCDAVIAFTHYAAAVALPVAASLGVPARVASLQNPVTSYPSVVRAIDMMLGSVGVYTGIAAVSRSVLESAQRYPRGYRRRMEIVYNGSQARPVPVRNHRGLAAKYEFSADSKIALAVGRLSDQKNHTVLLDSLVKCTEWSLIIAGEGPLRNALLSKATRLGVADRVRLPGNLSQDVLAEHLASADAFVMPSVSEGLSLALIEALHYSTPIVSSDIAPQQEVLIDDRGQPAAIFCAPHASEEWSSALRRITNLDPVVSLLTDAATRRAHAFSIEATVDGYLAMCSSIHHEL